MTNIDTHTSQTDWRCHFGLHHYVLKLDDNPEVRGQTVLQCTRCGRHEDGRPVVPTLGAAAAGLGFRG